MTEMMMMIDHDDDDVLYTLFAWPCLLTLLVGEEKRGMEEYPGT